MPNSSLPVRLSLFDCVGDNLVKPLDTTWGQFAQSLVTGHNVTEEHKLSLPCFSAWRYKDITDPTIDHGTDKHGKALKRFSTTHTRRIQSNLVELSMLVLDFDGKLPISEAQSKFAEYEHVGYTSLNHRVDGQDRFRIGIPFATPMPVADFLRLSSAIAHWLETVRAVGVDDSTLKIGQVFILPAVCAEHRSLAHAWRNEGALLDWRLFESISVPTKSAAAYNCAPSAASGVPLQLLPDDILQTSEGPIVVKNIDRKISRVLCPFHADAKPSEFVAVSKWGSPYLVCRRCGTIRMTEEDPIISGLKKIAERKRLNAVREE
ncbi:hypothetical protein HFK89_23780 [Ralstonia pseudosolanacearum]|uniref:hypothetical protein n=1 Tax=Ralstonia pseudosolanacearum TaxID=1310165 RepID=UPI0008F848A5|nr:hypothetical protein [Ralstonia pseudosolanacearum]MCK4165384.1 hypothetical protein [Ralstonia pseudosolanacearum]OIN68873.1 hypothetical protein BL248_22685 [Ralstonia solanacearum]